MFSKTEIIRSAQSTFNQIGHLYALCRDKTDKFTLLFSLIKLAMIRGRTVILCRTQIQAYRIKLFLTKFTIKTYVLASDMPKNQISSICHFFLNGHFDVLVMLHTGYGLRPVVKAAHTVVNFDVPLSYNQYKEAGQLAKDPNGSVITFVQPELDSEPMNQIQAKLYKNFGKSDKLLCLPILWEQLDKFRDRIETVLKTFSDKYVAYYKTIEFRKQLASHTVLKAHFTKTLDEQSAVNTKERYDAQLETSLLVLPDHVIPDALISDTVLSKRFV